MSRQCVDPSKIQAMMEYYVKVKEALNKGTLQGKVSRLMLWKARDLGIGLSTWYKHRK